MAFLCRSDTRVIKLIKNLGANAHHKQKRVLCMNKVDLVEDKKDLLKVAKEFEDLPGYERSVFVLRKNLYKSCKLFMFSNCSSLMQILHDLWTQGIWCERSCSVFDGPGAFLRSSFCAFYC